jgi:hypothetical protein
MDPVSIAIFAVVLGICAITGLSIVWWMVKSAVRMAVKMVVFTIAAVVMLGAIAAVAGVILLH